MAETVDTRVVEARFDSKQFEQGVDRTVKKLDELKKSLNLKNTEKSVAEIGNKISETSEKASNSLEKLEERFTSFFGMLKNKMISGIADDIVGGIMKIKHGIEGLITSLSSAQVSYGMQRYTDILTSVRTMTGAGVEQNRAYELIERLGIYADQTSYSLENLVDLMSKLMVGGAGESQAEKMVEGLSNAAASVGVNAQKATTAYYNFAQAYQKGAMLQQDWMSFQNIGMSGEKMNEMILKAAEEVGTLVKQTEKNGQIVYKTANKVDKMVKTSGGDSKGITAQNLGSKLSSRWFNKAVMEKWTAEMYYFSDISRAELGKIDDAIEGLDADKRSLWFVEHGLSEFAYNAFKAGQEARSFTDVLNTLKDAISRGWATSFELIFGKLDEATKFFTKLTESNFADAIYNIAEFRNEVLENWSNTGGRNTMLGTLQTIDDTLADILIKFGWLKDEGWDDRYFDEHFSQDEYNKYLNGGKYATTDKEGKEIELEGKEAAEKYKEDIKNAALEANPFDDFARELGQRLTQISIDIQDFFQRVRDWFSQTDKDGVSRLQRIQNILESFGTVFTGTMNAVGLGLKFVGDIYHSFQKTFDSLWAVFDKLAKTFAKNFDEDQIGDGINAFQILKDVFANILTVAEKLDPILSVIVDVLGEVASFFIDMGVSSVLMNLQFFTDAFALLLEVIGLGSAQQKRGEGVLKGIGDGIKQVGDACKSAFQAVTDFFSSLFADLRKLLGIGDDVGTEDGGLFKNIENWFNTNEFVQKVKAWIDKAIVDIGDFIKDMPNRIVDLGVTIGDFFKGIFYEKKVVSNGYGPEGLTSSYKWVEKPLFEWIKNAYETVKNFVIVEIPKFINRLPSIIEEFLNGLFYQNGKNGKVTKKYVNGRLVSYPVKTPLRVWIDQAIVDVKAFVKDIPNKIKKIPSIIGEFFKNLFYTPTTISGVGTVWTEKPFTMWIDQNIVQNLKKFVENLPTYIGQAIGTVTDIVGKVISALFGNPNTVAASSDNIENELEKPFLNIDLTSILNRIKEIGKKIIVGFTGIFSGSYDWDTNKNWWTGKIAEFITNVKEKAEKVWPDVQTWIEELPGKIAKLFTNNADNEKSEEKSEIKKAIDDFIDGFGKWLSTIPSTLLHTWQNVETQFGTIWDTIWDAITGNSKGKNELNSTYQKLYEDYMNNIGKSQSKDIQQSVYNGYLEAQWRKDNPIAANISDFFGELVEYLKKKVEKIPEDFQKVWKTALKIGEILGDVLIGDVPKDTNGDTDYGVPLYNTIADFFQSLIDWVGEWIVGLPDKIKEGFNTAIDIAKVIGEVLFGDNKPAFSQKKYDNILNHKIFKGAKDGLNKEFAEFYKESTHDYGNSMYNSIAGFFEDIVAWVKQEATNLPEKINIALKGIGDFAQQVGPTVLNGLKSVIDWLNEKGQLLTGWFEELLKDQNSGKRLSVKEFLDKKFTDDQGNENPLWTGIKNVGESLKNFMIHTIPEFIKEAVQVIAKKVPEILGGIFDGSLFGNKKSAKAIDKHLEMNEKRLAEHEKYIKKEGQEIEEGYWYILSGDSSGNVNSNAAENQANNIVDIAKSMLWISDAVAEESGTSSDSDTKKSKSVFDRIGELWSSITGFVDQISSSSTFKIVGIAAVLLLVIHEIRMLLDNIQPLDDIIGWNAKMVGITILITVFSGIMAYMTKLAAEAEEGSEAEKKLQRVKQIFTDLKQFLLDIMEPLKWILGFLMGKELFGMLKEFAKREKTVNLGGYTSAGSKILGVFTGPITSFLNSFSKMFGKTAAITTGADMIGSAAENISGSINDALGYLGSGIESFVDYLPDAIQKLQGLKDDIEGAILVIPSIERLFEELATLLSFEIEVPVEVRKINETNGMVETWEGPMVKQQEETSEVVTVMQKTTVDITSKVEELTKLFNDLSGSLSLFKNAITGYGDDATKVADAFKKIISSKSDMEAFAEFAESDKWNIFKSALMSFGAIYRLYQDSVDDTFNEKPKDLNISNVVDFLDQLFGNENFKSLIEKFASEGLPDINQQTLDNAEKIIIFAGALSLIAKACSELSDDGSEASSINKLIDMMGKIDFKNDDNIDRVVKNFGSLGNALGSFAVNTANLSRGNIDLADEALEMLLHIAVGLNQLPPDSFFSRLLFGSQTIDDFGVKIAELGRNLKHFFDNINGVDDEGNASAVNYNIANFEMALRAADMFSRIAVRFSGAIGGLNMFKDFSNIDFGPFAKSISNFINMFIGNDPENKIETFEDKDLEYFNKLLDITEQVSIIVKRFDNVNMTNLGSLDSKTNYFYEYINKIMGGVSKLGGEMYGYHAQLGWISTYKEDISNYLDLFTSITKMLNRLVMPFDGNGGRLDPEWATKWFTSISEGFLGKDTKVFGVENHTKGLFENLISFFDNVEMLETRINESPNALSFFEGFVNMLSSFADAVAEMAQSATIQTLFGGYSLDIETFVNKLAGVMQAIVNNQSIFTKFFDYGGQFDHNHLSNTLLMVSSLNEIAQMLSIFEESNFGSVLAKIEEFEWGRLFEIIQDKIVYTNTDFFNPEIRPVLVISDSFTAEAEKMRKMLGFTVDGDGTWISPNYTVNIEGINIPVLDNMDNTLGRIDTQLMYMRQQMLHFDEALGNMKFVINGEQLSAIISPTIDKMLGYSETEADRISFT